MGSAVGHPKTRLPENQIPKASGMHTGAGVVEGELSKKVHRPGSGDNQRTWAGQDDRQSDQTQDTPTNPSGIRFKKSWVTRAMTNPIDIERPPTPKPTLTSHLQLPSIATPDDHQKIPSIHRIKVMDGFNEEVSKCLVSVAKTARQNTNEALHTSARALNERGTSCLENTRTTNTSQGHNLHLNGNPMGCRTSTATMLAMGKISSSCGSDMGASTDAGNNNGIIAATRLSTGTSKPTTRDSVTDPNTRSGASTDTITNRDASTSPLDLTYTALRMSLADQLTDQRRLDVKSLPSMLGCPGRKRIEWDMKQRFEMSRFNLKPLPKKSAPGGESWSVTELKPHVVLCSPPIIRNEQQQIQDERDRIHQLLRGQREQHANPTGEDNTSEPSLKERLEKRQSTAADRRRDILEQRKQKCRERVDRAKHVDRENECQRSRVPVKCSDVTERANEELVLENYDPCEF